MESWSDLIIPFYGLYLRDDGHLAPLDGVIWFAILWVVFLQFFALLSTPHGVKRALLYFSLCPSLAKTFILLKSLFIGHTLKSLENRKKGIVGLGMVVSIFIAFVKCILYSFWSCLVIVIIRTCFVVLHESLIVAGILTPVPSDLQSRINKIFIQDKGCVGRGEGLLTVKVYVFF